MTNISLLPCSGSEDEFTQLRNMHRLCMRKKVEDSLGQWDEDAQCARLRKHYNEFGLSLKFIQKNDEVIGTINFHPKSFSVGESTQNLGFFEQIYIVPSWQGKGIASYVMALLAPENEEVHLSVLRKDIKAQGFYQKQGYHAYDEDAYQVFFKKSPASAPILKP